MKLFEKTDLNVNDIQYISDMVIKLTELRWKGCNHLCIENFAPDLFHRLMVERIKVKKAIDFLTKGG